MSVAQNLAEANFTKPSKRSVRNQSPMMVADQVGWTNLLKGVTADLCVEGLARRYVQAEQVGRILNRAIRTGENVILWGPPGHGKSEMVRYLLEVLNLTPESFILDFGEGMDEATVWGGLNFKRLNNEHILDYHPERSFLSRRIAVFEEGLDAPPQVLCSLKNTLTSKVLSKSADPYPVSTHVIIMCTNKNPDEISKLGDSYRAFIERFPLRLEVKWSDYSARSYVDMFSRLGYKNQEINFAFSEIIAQSNSGNVPVSPRTAHKALRIVLDSVAERGVENLDEAALAELAFIPELRKIGEKNSKKWAEKVAVAKDERRLDQFQQRFDEIISTKDQLGSAMSVMEAAASLSLVASDYSSVALHASLKERAETFQKRLEDGIRDLSDIALQRAKGQVKKNPS